MFLASFIFWTFPYDAIDPFKALILIILWACDQLIVRRAKL